MNYNNWTTLGVKIELRIRVCPDELVDTVIDERVLLHRLHHPRSLELNLLHRLEDIDHSLHTQPLDAVTEGAEYARGA